MCRSSRAYGLAGDAVDDGLPEVVGRCGQARLTVLMLSGNQLYSGLTVWYGQCNQYYTTKPLNSSRPYAPLYTNMILCHQAAHSLVARYSPTDPSGLRTGPESHGEVSARACLGRHPVKRNGTGTELPNPLVEGMLSTLKPAIFLAFYHSKFG